MDLELIAELAKDPRQTQTAMARMVGMTVETVAARLRRLRDESVIATTIVVDWQAAGYRAGAISRLRLHRPLSEEQVKRIVETPGVHFLSLATGCCDIVVAVLGTDLIQLRESLSQIARDNGLRLMSADVVAGSPIFDVTQHTLPLQPWSPEDLPEPVIDLDDLDCQLMEQLAFAGHKSMRQVARHLSVSPGTVRVRLERLEESGLVRLVGARDPVATGEMQRYAMAFLSCSSLDAADALRGHRNVASVHQSIGCADLIVMVGSHGDRQLDHVLLQELRELPGVYDMEVAHLSSVIYHQTHLVRLR